MLSFSTISASLLAATPCLAHISMWHPSMYGFDRSSVTPLADQSYPQWFMHGFQNDQPREVMDLPAGGQVTIETTCRKDFTTYGSQTTDANDPMSACPIDANSYHAVRAGDGWDDTLGCALAFADSNDVWGAMPEDYVVFSVNQQCVSGRETRFDIPQSMPSCSHDWCLCAWTWGGKVSANEMYHIGFRCRPSGTQDGATLLPAGEGESKNPWYWANWGHQNVERGSFGYNDKPSYLDRSGFSDGAQEGISTGSSSGGGSGGGGGGGGGWGGGGGGGGGSSGGGGGGGGGWFGGGGGGGHVAGSENFKVNPGGSNEDSSAQEEAASSEQEPEASSTYDYTPPEEEYMISSTQHTEPTSSHSSESDDWSEENQEASGDWQEEDAASPDAGSGSHQQESQDSNRFTQDQPQNQGDDQHNQNKSDHGADKAQKKEDCDEYGNPITTTSQQHQQDQPATSTPAYTPPEDAYTSSAAPVESTIQPEQQEGDSSWEQEQSKEDKSWEKPEEDKSWEKEQPKEDKSWEKEQPKEDKSWEKKQPKEDKSWEKPEEDKSWKKQPDHGNESWKKEKKHGEDKSWEQKDPKDCDDDKQKKKQQQQQHGGYRKRSSPAHRFVRHRRSSL